MVSFENVSVKPCEPVLSKRKRYQAGAFQSFEDIKAPFSIAQEKCKELKKCDEVGKG